MSDQFTFSRIQHITQRSREIGSTAPPQRVGVSSADVLCKCGHQWRATNGRDLTGVLGGVHVQCPACRADGVVSGRNLQI